MSSSPQLALKLLKDIAQSVPMAAKSLYRLPVDKELRREVAANQKVCAHLHWDYCCFTCSVNCCQVVSFFIEK